MSDKIKSEYNKYADKIKPSEEFASRLTQTLEEEKAKKRYPRLRYIRQIGVAAACLIVALAAALVVNRGFGPAPTPDGTSSYEEHPTSAIDNQAGEINTEALNIENFQNISWYDKSLDAESLPLALAKKLEASLDYLEYSGENKFVGAEKADGERLARIKALLASAEKTDESVSGERVYYMAVFTDGTVAKFSVAAEKYLEITGDKNIYKNMTE